LILGVIAISPVFLNGGSLVIVGEIAIYTWAKSALLPTISKHLFKKSTYTISLVINFSPNLFHSLQNLFHSLSFALTVINLFHHNDLAESFISLVCFFATSSIFVRLPKKPTTLRRHLLSVQRNYCIMAQVKWSRKKKKKGVAMPL
jgi:hypothetical protein